MLNAVDVEAYVFLSVDNQKKIVAWGTGKLSITQTDRIRIVDRDGNEIIIVDGGSGDLDGIQNNTIEFQTSIDPVFIGFD